MVAYSFKKQFVQPIRVGLSSVRLSFDPAPKLQTIRAHGKRRHARPGEPVQLYTAMRTKQCELIGVGICTETPPITISLHSARGLMTFHMDGRLIPSTSDEGIAFCQADGFETPQHMWDFWRTEHPGVDSFDGVVIKWRPQTAGERT